MWDTVLSLLPVPQPQAENRNPRSALLSVLRVKRHARASMATESPVGSPRRGQQYVLRPLRCAADRPRLVRAAQLGLDAEGRCRRRGTAAASAFEAQPSTWGPRSHPVQFE
jgi:hypothetical protein